MVPESKSSPLRAFPDHSSYLDLVLPAVLAPPLPVPPPQQPQQQPQEQRNADDHPDHQADLPSGQSDALIAATVARRWRGKTQGLAGPGVVIIWSRTHTVDDVGGPEEGWCPGWLRGGEGNCTARGSKPCEVGEYHVSGGVVGIVSELLKGVVGGLGCDAPLGMRRESDEVAMKCGEAGSTLRAGLHKGVVFKHTVLRLPR